MDFVLVVAAGFLAAIIAPWLPRYTKQFTGWILAAVPLTIFLYLTLGILPSFLATKDPSPIIRNIEWVPSMGINLTFYVDGLSLMMALLVSGIGALIFIYAQGYLDDDPHIGRFFVFLLCFMSAMFGVVLAGNLITLFIFWEITSICSYLLIGYKHKYNASRKAASQALIITGGGGLALMAGLLVIGGVGGTFDIATLLEAGSIAESPLYLAALIPVLAGGFTKSAQVPFHFWLPGAMAAPTPVSAYLHSATMVKLGIFLLARLTPILGYTDTWFVVVTLFGAATMFIGAFLSWQNTDLKKILAYSTISVLGTLIMLLGIGAKEEYAFEALFVFLLAHALYKGALFMAAGAVDHATGTREIDQLSGLRKEMPFTFAAVVIACLSKAGIPFFLGFVGKELLYEATLHAPDAWIIGLTALAVISNSMVGVSAALVAIKPFMGSEVVAPHHVHRPSVALWIGPVILSIGSLVFGLLPGLLDGIGSAFSSGVSAEKFELHLAIFHFEYGIPTSFWLSVLTVALLVVLYFLRDRLIPILKPLKGDNWGSQRVYDSGLEGVLKSAEWITKFLQNGNLRWYVGIIISSTVGLVGFTIFTQTEFLITPDFTGIQIHEVILLVVIIIGAIAAAVFDSRLASIAAIGVVGFAIATFFIFFNAPDLAMTQYAIETLSVILIALIMGRLPQFFPEAGFRDRGSTILIAALAGVMMTVIVMLVLSFPLESQLTSGFTELSYEKAKGRNIVNVILVDFRGFDTFGEIIVLAIAGIGVFALSRLHITKEDQEQ